jgi:hypothetical protein
MRQGVVRRAWIQEGHERRARGLHHLRANAPRGQGHAGDGTLRHVAAPDATLGIPAPAIPRSTDRGGELAGDWHASRITLNMAWRKSRFFLLLATTSLLSAACGGIAEPLASHGDPPPAQQDGGVALVADDGGGGAPESTTTAGVIAQVSGLISAVAMDDTTIYFAWNDSISSVPKDGSAPAREIGETGSAYIEGIAVDGTDVYVTDLVGGTIGRIPKGGGVVETVATGQLRPWGIAVDDARVYWANQGTDTTGAPGNDGSIMALDKAGGSPVVLAGGEQMPTAIALFSGTLVWADGPWGAENGMIRSLGLGLDAGAPTALASNLDNVGIPVVADGRVYFAVDGDLGNAGLIEAVPLGGTGGNPLVAAFPSEGPVALAADSSSLYYAAIGGQPGAVFAMPLAGGAPTEVTPPPTVPAALEVGETPQFLLVDATRVFVFDYYAVATTGMQGLVRAYAK